MSECIIQHSPEGRGKIEAGPLVSVRRIWSNMYLAILSGILLALAYPVFNLEFLAFVAFVPLFFAIKNKNLKQAFFLSYFSGIVFWLLTIYWLIHVTLLGWILLVLYLALYFGVFGLFFRFIISPCHPEAEGRRIFRSFASLRMTNCSKVLILFIPAAWVFLEYLRSKLLTGFPWALLGYSQYLNLPLIQIADIVGAGGVSFLVMVVNVGIDQILDSRFWILDSGFSWSKKVLLPMACIVFTFCYGYYKLHLSSIQHPVSNLKISLIQGSIPQEQKWDEGFRESILERYEMLTREAAKDNPALIIWPETAVPGVIGEEPELLARILKLAKDIKVPLLVGAVTAATAVRSLPEGRAEPPRRGPARQRPSAPATSYYNSAILISSDGKILQQYDKLLLVPFGEYVPLERYFPFLRGLIGTPIGDFTAGKEYTLFGIQYPVSSIQYQFAVLICFEDIIPELSHKFVKNKAQFLVNITNDAWFKETSAPYQHAAASVFRAVENRVPVVRAANTGFSCFIDRTGRIYDKVSAGKKDIFVVGYKTREIEVRK